MLKFELPAYKKLTEEFLDLIEQFSDWKQLLPQFGQIEILDELDRDSEMQEFFEKIQQESTVALFFVYTDPELLCR